uniref:Uncharacterized protein n=1 Tax=Anguilla anguilla TaxID=7936 RepID=A0A0E9T8C9_ANGAN
MTFTDITYKLCRLLTKLGYFMKPDSLYIFGS